MGFKRIWDKTIEGVAKVDCRSLGGLDPVNAMGLNSGFSWQEVVGVLFALEYY